MNINKFRVDFLKTCEKIEPTFVTKALPFDMNVRWAALRMEIFFICALCEHFSCRKIVESGTGLGFSALMFERYYRGTGVSVTTIDNCQREENIFKDVVDPVEYIIGDGHKIVPEVIEQNKYKNVGLFIDGPKGNDAYRLAEKCFEFDNVPFAVIHDEGPSSIQRGNSKEFQGKTICSWHPWFKNKYIYMDEEALVRFEQNNLKKLMWGFQHIMEYSKHCGQGAMCILSPKTLESFESK